MGNGETKTSMYRRAMAALGAEAGYDEFAAYCREEFGIDASRSGYYDAKKSGREAPAALADDEVTPAVPEATPAPPTHAAPAPSESGLIRVADLPSLMEQARALLAAFGGDKDALAKFIRLV